MLRKQSMLEWEWLFLSSSKLNWRYSWVLIHYDRQTQHISAIDKTGKLPVTVNMGCRTHTEEGAKEDWRVVAPRGLPRTLCIRASTHARTRAMSRRVQHFTHNASSTTRHATRSRDAQAIVLPVGSPPTSDAVNVKHRSIRPVQEESKFTDGHACWRCPHGLS